MYMYMYIGMLPPLKENSGSHEGLGWNIPSLGM